MNDEELKLQQVAEYWRRQADSWKERAYELTRENNYMRHVIVTTDALTAYESLPIGR